MDSQLLWNDPTISISRHIEAAKIQECVSLIFAVPIASVVVDENPWEKVNSKIAVVCELDIFPTVSFPLELTITLLAIQAPPKFEALKRLAQAFEADLLVDRGDWFPMNYFLIKPDGSIKKVIVEEDEVTNELFIIKIDEL